MKPRLPSGHGQTAPSAGSVHPIVSPHWGATQCPPRKKGKIAIAEPLFRRWQLRLSPQDSIFGSFKSISGATDWQMAHFDFTSRSDGIRENSKKVLKSLENTWPNSFLKKMRKKGINHSRPFSSSPFQERKLFGMGEPPLARFFSGGHCSWERIFCAESSQPPHTLCSTQKKTSAGP